MHKPAHKPKLQKEKNNTRLYIAIAAIVLAVLWAYSPAFKADFVNLDDPQDVTKNEHIRSLSFENTARLFYKPKSELYIPMVYLSYSIEYYFDQLNPQRYHADNILLHVINSLLLFWLLWLLFKNLLACVIITGLFALHPFHVESVAWVTERKDVLYTSFYLASIICYHFYSQKKEGKYYLLSLLLFVLSCMSKPMAITMPAVLLLYDYFYLKQRSWKMILNKLPFFAGTVVFTIVTLKLFPPSQESLFTNHYTAFDKLIMILYSLWFYLQKTLLPINLSAMYTYPEKTGGLLPVYFIICACLTLLLACFVAFSKYSNGLIKACSLFYVATISPVIQIFANTYTVTADRYSYVPTLGFLGIAAYIVHLAIEKQKIKETTAWVFVIVALLVCSIATYNRCEIWKDSFGLYGNIIERGQYTPAAYANYGDTYVNRGDNAKALSIFAEADKKYPNTAAVKNRYAWALDAVGRTNEAILQYEQCLLLDSTIVGTYINLGSAYLKSNRLGEALSCFKKATLLYPKDNTARYNLGYTYWLLNERDEAVRHFRKAAADNFQPAIDFLVRQNISPK